MADPVENVDLHEAIKTTAATVMNTVQPAASRFMSAASPAASRFMNVAVPAAATAMDAVRPMTSSIASAVGPAANTVSQAMKEAGRASIDVLGKAGRFVPPMGVLLRGFLPTIAVIKGVNDYIEGGRKNDMPKMGWGLGDTLAGIASYSGIGTIPALAYADAKSIAKGEKKALDEWGLEVDDDDGFNSLGLSSASMKSIRGRGA